jgi:hypothetical protein
MTDGLSDRARSLIEAAKQQGGPSRAQQAKMAAAVVAATSSTAAAFGAGTAGAVASTVSVTKLVGAGVVAALLGVGGTVAVTKAVSPAGPSRAQPVVVTPSTTAPAPAAVPAMVEREASLAAGNDERNLRTDTDDGSAAPTAGRPGAGAGLHPGASAGSDDGVPSVAEPDGRAAGASPELGRAAGPSRRGTDELATASTRAATASSPGPRVGPATPTPEQKGPVAVAASLKLDTAAPPSPEADAPPDTGKARAEAMDATVTGRAPAPTAGVVGTPNARARTAEPPTERPSSRAGPADSTAAEVTALSAAMEALDAKDFTQALDLARTARRAHPTGALRPELTLLEVEALCGLSRVDEAQDVADAMPPVDRTALVRERLRRSCVSTK